MSVCAATDYPQDVDVELDVDYYLLELDQFYLDYEPDVDYYLLELDQFDLDYELNVTASLLELDQFDFSYTFNTKLYLNGTLMQQFWYIIVSTDGDCIISPDGDGSGEVPVLEGQTQNFTITPINGYYYISTVLVDGGYEGQLLSYSFENVNQNHTLYAAGSPIPTGSSYIISRFSFEDSNPEPDESIYFDGSISESSDSITNYSWNFGDGNTTAGGGYSTIYHSFSSVGTYTVNLTITSAAGSDSFVQNITIETATYITALFNFTASNPEPEDLVFFDGSVSQSSHSITNYSWNFGDGNTTAGGGYSTIYHSFTIAGTYNVNLTITSAAGSDSFVQAVVVAASGIEYVEDTDFTDPGDLAAVLMAAFILLPLTILFLWKIGRRR